MNANHFFLGASLAVTGVAAVTDFRTGHIPNWLTLGTLAAAPIVHFAVGFSAGGFHAGAIQAGFSLLGALACSVVPTLLYSLKGMFGGDVKLLMAIGALLRPMLGVEAEFYAFVAAAVYAPARMAWEGKLLNVLGNTAALVVNPILPKAYRREVSAEMMTEMRFGPCIFAGAITSAIVNWRVH